MYILEIPTQQARGIVINPKIGKYKAIITANENAPVVCPEGKEYLSIPIFFIFKFGISIKGLSLVTLTLRSLTNASTDCYRNHSLNSHDVKQGTT